MLRASARGAVLVSVGLRRGFKPFHVRANSGILGNRTDVFATSASTSGP
jgi:hypothetical protein